MYNFPNKREPFSFKKHSKKWTSTWNEVYSTLVKFLESSYLANVNSDGPVCKRDHQPQFEKSEYEYEVIFYK